MEAAEGSSLLAPGLMPAGCITTNQPEICSQDRRRKTFKNHFCYRSVFKSQPQECLFFMSSATGSKSQETVHYDTFFLTWLRGQFPDDSLQLVLNSSWDQEARTH